MASHAHHEPSLPDGLRRETLASLALSLLGGTLSIWTVLDRGWVPFDEGTIAQAAERVLHGQLPHLDFTDPYTGGLPYLHALAMRAFGVSLMAPRFALFLAFTLWLPAVRWLAMRSCGRRWAVVITIVSAWWSLPIYPAAMPTWYLLFMGTWIVVALERWHDSRRAYWLVVGGVLCGLAVTVKQTGLFVVAGALLGLLFCEQEDTRLRWPDGKPAGHTDPIVVLLLASLATLRESRLTDDFARRWRSLGKSAGIVVLAAAVPICLFLLPYVRQGAMGNLLDGTVGDGVRRLTDLSRGMRSAGTLLRAA